LAADIHFYFARHSVNATKRKTKHAGVRGANTALHHLDTLLVTARNSSKRITAAATFRALIATVRDYLICVALAHVAAHHDAQNRSSENHGLFSKDSSNK
jgi:hypothetical protein